MDSITKLGALLMLLALCKNDGMMKAPFPQAFKMPSLYMFFIGEVMFMW